MILKFFNLIDIGERSGSGIPSIFSVWKGQGFYEPKIVESFEPERIKLQLDFKKTAIKKSLIKIGEKNADAKELLSIAKEYDYI
ncbi:MAG: hypothetical protein ACOYBV_02935 [Candidatus Avilachnospira sp.]